MTALPDLSASPAASIVMDPGPVPKPGTARIFPNPFRPSTDSYVTIDRVPANSRVRIFTLRGELVSVVEELCSSA